MKGESITVWAMVGLNVVGPREGEEVAWTARVGDEAKEVVQSRSECH